MTTPDIKRKFALADSFTKALTTQDMSSEKDFINDMLNQITEPPKKIPEPVFREIFLPYFTGEKTPDANNSAIAHWIGLVGSASEVADIVNVKGEVLFQVPPMCDSSRLNVTDRGNGRNFAQIFTTYGEESKVHPAMGQRYLVEELSKKADVGIPEVESKGVTWEPCLRHYNLLPKETKAIKSQAAQDDDDFIFD